MFTAMLIRGANVQLVNKCLAGCVKQNRNLSILFGTPCARTQFQLLDINRKSVCWSTRNNASLIGRNYSTLPPKKQNTSTGPFNWRTLFITFGVGTCFLAFFLYVKREKDIAIDKERKRQLGKASIGGSFDLIDHNNKPLSSQDLMGQWLLLYFGFTHCPDVCPDEIDKMVECINILDSRTDLPRVQPLFITVDPDRDDVNAVKNYIGEFSPRIIGLTGSKEKIDQAAKAYRVYYSSGPTDIDKDYIVDHTIITYLIDPEGKFIDYFGQTSDAQMMADNIAIHMAKYDRLKNPFSFFSRK